MNEGEHKDIMTQKKKSKKKIDWSFVGKRNPMRSKRKSEGKRERRETKQKTKGRKIESREER